MAVETNFRVDRGGARFGGPMEDEPPIGELFRQLSDDASQLIRQEVALGKAELREAATVIGKGAARLGIAAGLALLGGLAAVAFMIVALGDLLDNYWLSSLIVAVVLLGVAAVMGKGAMTDLKRRDLKPTQTIQTLKADAAWAKRETTAIKKEWQS